jgi:hypothetical protein
MHRPMVFLNGSLLREGKDYSVSFSYSSIYLDMLNLELGDDIQYVDKYSNLSTKVELIDYGFIRLSHLQYGGEFRSLEVKRASYINNSWYTPLPNLDEPPPPPTQSDAYRELKASADSITEILKGISENIITSPEQNSGEQIISKDG